MAVLTVQNINRAGLNPSYSAASGGGDTVPCERNQRTFLYVKNASGGSINVTVTAVAPAVIVPGYGSMTFSDNVVAVGAGTEKAIGPFTAREIDGSGNIAVAYSATASVTVAAMCMNRTD